MACGRLAPRQTTFRELTASGRSDKRAKELIQLVERASASEFKPVPGSKASRYFLPGGPRTAPTISHREFIKRSQGATPEVLAAERRAGLRAYKSAASEAQVAKAAKTRKWTARKREVAERRGFARGRKQRQAVREYLDDMMARHDRYLRTGQGKLPESEYRKAAHLALEYLGDDDERVQRMNVEACTMNERSINYRRLGELSDEFTALWERLQAFYLDSVAGFYFLTEHLRDEQAKARSFVQESGLDSEEFQNTRMFSYDDIFPDEFCTSGIHRATQGEVKVRNAKNGAKFKTLGQLCLVSFYDFWDDYLRFEYVKAKGLYDSKNHDRCLREHASRDLWGDLYYLRTAIVHHRGIATDAVAKCKLIKWFKPGDQIAISPDGMRAIFLALLTFRNELHREQFEPTTFLLEG
jgi:hypothetical protein